MGRAEGGCRRLSCWRERATRRPPAPHNVHVLALALLARVGGGNEAHIARIEAHSARNALRRASPAAGAGAGVTWRGSPGVELLCHPDAPGDALCKRRPKRAPGFRAAGRPRDKLDAHARLLRAAARDGGGACGGRTERDAKRGCVGGVRWVRHICAVAHLRYQGMGPGVVWSRDVGDQGRSS